jgi:hypothetical protein
MIAAILFSVYFYGQDVLSGNADSLAGSVTGGLSERKDNGREVENGLFFTKSFYEETGSESDALPESGKKQLSKTFEMEVEHGKDYFLAAHILPANNVEKLVETRSGDSQEPDNRVDILDVRVYLNGQLIGTLNQTKLDWELAPLKEAETVYLHEGKNILRFESDAPYYPMVDAVRITESEDDLMIENKVYDEFIAYLKSNPQRVLPEEKETQDEIDRILRESIDAGNTPGLRSAMFPNSSGWQMVPHVFPAPEGNFGHRMNVPITPTYYRTLSLSAGNYTFNTAPISGDNNTSVDPVMYLYKINDPYTYSWYNDDYNPNTNGRQSWVSVSNIPAGDYCLVVRAYNSSFASSALGRQGLVDIYQNGSILNSSMPVAGVMFDISHDTSNRGDLNYFTAYTTGIPVIWLLENIPNNNHKMKFKGGTGIYIDPMDYLWLDDARMVFPKSTSETYSMLVSAEGAMGFYFGNCDAYGNIPTGRPGNNPDLFPNLKLGDAMISAPANINYNCHAWAGGISTGWIQNMGYGISYRSGSGNIWSSWDDYFGNNPSRYVGATTYTRNQAHAGNGEIALWSYNSNIADASHSSVRLLANDNPHGYDWESKCGDYERIFHPRNALSGPNTTHGFGYGSIIAYYRDANKTPDEISVYSASADPDDSERKNILALRSAKSSSPVPTFTMAESIEKGLTVIEDVKLDADQMDFITSKNSVKTRSASILQSLFNNWKEKIHSPVLSLVSNPYKFIETDEGKQLVEYAKKNMEESIIFFAQIVFADEESSFKKEKHIAEYLFCEIAKDNYAFIMENIKDEWENNNYDNLGRYKAPMPETFVKKYIKQLLDKVVLKKGETYNPAVNTIDNHNTINISPNPVYDYAAINLNLPQKSTVSIRVFSQASHLIATILDRKILENGKHSFSLDASSLSKGIYVCVAEINGTVYSRKLLKY